MLSPDSVLQNRYRVQRELGHGGMGTVYEALDQRVNCLVALKETSSENDAEARRAFEREASLLGNLRHSALPKVMDYFSEGDGDYLVMEFIPGYDLAELLELRGSPFPQGQVIRWADDLLRVLEYLHGQQPPILHRDIKPSNLKLTQQGEIFLLDFGLAKGATGLMPAVTSKSVHGYTPYYASLEQIHGHGTDPRSDLYSLGATMYHLLTNSPPVDAPARFIKIDDEQPDPLPAIRSINPEVSPNLAELVHRAMSVNRRQRPSGAAEMRKALRLAIEEDEQRAGEEEYRRAEVMRQQRETERRKAEAEATRLAAEQEQLRREEEARRLEEQRRREAEEEATRTALEERRRKDAAAQREREEAERKRKEAEAAERARTEEAEKRRIEEEKERQLIYAEEHARAEAAAEAERIKAQREAEEKARERAKLAITQAAATVRATEPPKPEPKPKPSIETIYVPEPIVTIDAGLDAPLVSGRFFTPARIFIGLAIALVILIGSAAIGLTAWLTSRPATASREVATANQPPSVTEPKTGPAPVAPEEMVYIPGGTFMMGSDNSNDKTQEPVHKVSVNPFFIDVHEVTNQQYQQFVDETGHTAPRNWDNKRFPSGKNRWPVTDVTWDDANDYAKWAGKRLPTEEEWEFAARGTDGRKFPWGNDWQPGLANADNADGSITEVGKYKGISPFGLVDMIGNAWEWTASDFKSYSTGAVITRGTRVIRGGAFNADRNSISATFRSGYPQNNKVTDYANTGFRCAKDVK